MGSTTRKPGAPKMLLVADDHAATRSKIKEILSAEPDWSVYEEARDGAEAVRKAKEFCPDVVILDISMPKLNGIEAARQISEICPSTLAILSSTHDAHLFADRLKEAGVRGFVPKDSIHLALIPAIKEILAGHTYFSEP